jgi:hypothetical protein
MDRLHDPLVVSAARTVGPWLVRRNPSGDSELGEPIRSDPSPGFLAVGTSRSPAPGEPLPGMPGLAILDPNNGHSPCSTPTACSSRGSTTPRSAHRFDVDINSDGRLHLT